MTDLKSLGTTEPGFEWEKTMLPHILASIPPEELQKSVYNKWIDSLPN